MSDSPDPKGPGLGDIVELAPNVRLKITAIPAPGYIEHEDCEAEVELAILGKKGSVMASVSIDVPYWWLRVREKNRG